MSELKGNSEFYDIPPKDPLCLQLNDIMTRNTTGKGFIGVNALMKDLSLRICIRNSEQVDFLRIVVFVDHQLYVGDSYNRMFNVTKGSPSIWPYNLDNMKTVTILDDFVVPLSTYLWASGVGLNNGDRPYFIERSYNDLDIRCQFEPDYSFCTRNALLLYILHDKLDDGGFEGELTWTLRWKDV